MFNLFKSKKRDSHARDSNVEKSITTGSLLNLVNQSKEVRGIYTVPIEDIFTVIIGRIKNSRESDSYSYPLDKIKEDYVTINGKGIVNRYKRICYANMTWEGFRALCEKWQEVYIGLDCTEVKDIFTDVKVLQYIKDDIYIKARVSFYAAMSLPISLNIEMWSDDTDQLRQAYLKMIEMIDIVKYGEE